MVRKIGAVVGGVLVVGVVVLLLQQISSALHPLPEGMDAFDPEQADAFREHMAAMPVAAWIGAFSSELIGAFAGALVAGRIAREGGARVVSGVVVGFAVMGSTANWIAFEHPTWFIVGQLIGYPMVLMGAWALLGRGATPEEEGLS